MVQLLIIPHRGGIFRITMDEGTLEQIVQWWHDPTRAGELLTVGNYSGYQRDIAELAVTL